MLRSGGVDAGLFHLTVSLSGKGRAAFRFQFPGRSIQTAVFSDGGVPEIRGDRAAGRRFELAAEKQADGFWIEGLAGLGEELFGDLFVGKIRGHVVVDHREATRGPWDLGPG